MGRKHTKEYKKRKSEDMKQIWQNPEYRKHMSEAHKGKIGELSPSWKGGKLKAVERHKEKEIKTSRLYRIKNRHKIKKYNQEYRRENKDLYAFCARLRLYRRKNADGFHTFGNWENLKAQYNFTCPCCKRKEPEIKLTEDHIVPLSRGGSNNIENIQPLCNQCNSSKNTKIIKYGTFN